LTAIFTCDVNRVSEHARTMSRVPEKMSFTHAELGADQRIRRPRCVDVNSITRD